MKDKVAETASKEVFAETCEMMSWKRRSKEEEIYLAYELHAKCVVNETINEENPDEMLLGKYYIANFTNFF